LEKVRAHHKTLRIEAGLNADEVPAAGKVVPPDA
jgi:hypothetical protein